MPMFLDFVGALVAQESTKMHHILHLFGGPFVTFGTHRSHLPEGSKRLVVFIALHRGHVDRRYAASALWPVGNDERASGNLRSALWRLNRAGISLLSSDKHSLAISKDVLVDVHLVSAWAGRLLRATASEADLSVMPWGVDALELLPGWYDDWVLLERERVRQRLLHALEALSQQLARLGRSAEAVEAAMIAVSADPLRESAQRALIEAHLAEGNLIEGRRTFEAYRELLYREIAAEPDRTLASLLRLDHQSRGNATSFGRHGVTPRQANAALGS
jgi:DNA-binding SARP family transcriptional activator